ncbi:hypothetical protein CNO08_05320 [Lysobacter capsici]|nr:hypothetical protein CNO08_05320 [Lysobacter capsici]
MPWTQALGVCEGFAEAVAGAGSASGARATAVAATVFEHPRMHASSRQVRLIDDAARRPCGAMESMTWKAPFGGACDSGAPAEARVARISFACLNQILQRPRPAVA